MKAERCSNPTNMCLIEWENTHTGFEFFIDRPIKSLLCIFSQRRMLRTKKPHVSFSKYFDSFFTYFKESNAVRPQIFWSKICPCKCRKKITILTWFTSRSRMNIHGSSLNQSRSVSKLLKDPFYQLNIFLFYLWNYYNYIQS